MVRCQTFKTLENWKTDRHAPLYEIPDAKLTYVKNLETKEIHMRVTTTDYPVILTLSTDEAVNLISDLKNELKNLIEGI